MQNIIPVHFLKQEQYSNIITVHVTLILDFGHCVNKTDEDTLISIFDIDSRQYMYYFTSLKEQGQKPVLNSCDLQFLRRLSSTNLHDL